jgi:Na+/proline symporter
LPRKSSRVLVGSGARGDRRDPRDASSLSFCVFPFRISFLAPPPLDTPPATMQNLRDPSMLSRYDYLVIAFYFVFILSMGWIFKRFIKNTSDYFRSGGEMLWWIVGAGAFMTNFSALSFTAHAGKAYQDGPVLLVIFFGNAFAFFLNYLYFAPAFRQMRCITAMDAVRRRFGAANEQFFTWLQIPMGILQAALWLFGLAIFLYAAFGFEMKHTIMASGAVVIFITVLGGSWSTNASEFVQMLLLMPVTVVAAVFALVKIGGVNAFFERTPRHFWHWGQVADSRLIFFWTAAILLQRLIVINNMTDASRYLSVKDSRHARKAALLAGALFIIGPIVWFIPPMVARVTHPNLAEMFPGVNNPAETSYFAICVSTMPIGMLGLLLSGIFASTMGQMDTGLNRNAGYFIKNFYQAQLRPAASEREQLVAGKITTIVFGAIIIVVTLWFETLKHAKLFDLMIQLSAWIGLPITVPLIWGMFIRRAPSWAGWSSVLVALAVSYLSEKFLTAKWLSGHVGFTLNPREASDWSQAIGLVLNVFAGSVWFLLTPLMSPRRPPAEVERVDRFFHDMNTPVNFEREQGPGSDNLQAKIMGILCLIYGGFITALALIPNPLSGRIAFVFCGAVMFGVGWLLHRGSKFKASRAEAAARGIDDSATMSAGQSAKVEERTIA